MAKHVRINLFDQASLDAAVRRINRLYDNFCKDNDSMLYQLADDGADYARQRVLAYGAIETETLYNSIMPGASIDPKKRYTSVLATAPYAAFVEYGTGIVGSGESHPNPDGWDYDVNDHGDAGWWYYDWAYSNWRWTKGQPAKPFMYDTKLYLEQKAPKIAAKLYRNL